MRFALIARESTPTNESIAGAIVDGVRWELMSPEEALHMLRPGDAALGRLDVLPTLDGIEDGMWALGALEARLSVILVLTDRLVTYVPVRLGAGGGLTPRLGVGRSGLTCTRSVARRRPRSTSVT